VRGSIASHHPISLSQSCLQVLRREKRQGKGRKSKTRSIHQPTTPKVPFLLHVLLAINHRWPFSVVSHICFWAFCSIWVDGVVLIILVLFHFHWDFQKLLGMCSCDWLWLGLFSRVHGFFVNLVLIDNSLIDCATKMLGNGVLKSIEEEGSNGGEGKVPAYNGHGDQHNPFKDGSEELESAAQPHASDVESLKVVSSDVKIDQELGGKEDCVVLVERSLKSEESFEGKNISFEHNETAKESYFENGNASDTSKGESLSEKNSDNGNCVSVKEAIVCHVFVKSNDSVSEGENNDSGSVVLEKSVVHPEEVTNLSMKINEDKVSPLTNENVTTLSMGEPKPKECDGKILTPVSASPFTKFTNGAEHIKGCELAESYNNQVLHFLISTLQVFHHTIFVNFLFGSDFKYIFLCCINMQPHAALAPNVVKKTSWLSCCGLFEVLSSSNR